MSGPSMPASFVHASNGARSCPRRARRATSGSTMVAHGLAAELRERGVCLCLRERHVRVGEHRGPAPQCVERTVRGVMGEHEESAYEKSAVVWMTRFDGLFERRWNVRPPSSSVMISAAPLDVAGRHLLGIHLVLHSFLHISPARRGVSRTASRLCSRPSPRSCGKARAR